MLGGLGYVLWNLSRGRRESQERTPMRPNFEWLAGIVRAKTAPADAAAFYRDLQRAAPEFLLYVAELEEAVRPLAQLEPRKVALADRDAVTIQRAVNLARAIYGRNATAETSAG